jgi:2-polyprenyl-6-methoxyphenol hydroxylase-like FAD-dependent oxidoreductase
MATHNFTVAIIGAGLGGLAAGIGIARAGHDVTILEQASALAEVSREHILSTGETKVVHTVDL